MRKSLLWLNAIFALGLIGCRNPQVVVTAERSFNQGRSIQTRYWEQQEAHRPKPSNDDFELLPIPLPARKEDGVIHTPSTLFLRIPRTP